MGAVTPETCRVTLQQINVCILLRCCLLTLNHDARNHELKKKIGPYWSKITTPSNDFVTSVCTLITIHVYIFLRQHPNKGKI